MCWWWVEPNCLFSRADIPSSRMSTVWSRWLTPGRCLSTSLCCSVGESRKHLSSVSTERSVSLTTRRLSLLSPTSDGAGAAVLASEAFVRKHHLESQAVEIVAQEMATDISSTFEENSCMKMVSFLPDWWKWRAAPPKRVHKLERTMSEPSGRPVGLGSAGAP